MAVANHASGSVSVLMGKGDGTFTAATNYALPPVGSPTAVAAGDLNGDSQTDLAVTTDGNDYLKTLFNNGNGTFSTPVNYPCHIQGCGPSDVAIFDMDSDRDADLAVANWNHDTVTTYRNIGSGHFLVYGNFPVGNRTNAIEPADLDNDGDTDLAVGDSIGNYAFSALLNKGFGSFASPVGYGPVEEQAFTFKQDLTVGDFNNDGLKDVASSARIINVAGSGKVYVLLGQGNGTFGAAKTYRTGGRAWGVTAANLDGDNTLDLAVADVDSGIVVLPGNGDGTFGSATTYGVGTNPWSVVSGSFGGPSGAGADLAVANHGSANVSILLNTTPPATSCTITGTSGNDVLSGTSGRDVICGLGGADTLKGVEGEDVIKGGAGSDILQGNLGNDTVIGGGGADRLYGGEGNDALDSKDGVRGNDRLDGGVGTDTNVTDAREASIIGFP